jgi:hypothetical protein
MAEYEVTDATARVRMSGWFYGPERSDEDRRRWLDAVWSPDSVPAALLETLPKGRYSRRLTPDPMPEWWVYATSGSSGPTRPGTVPYYRMSTEFKEFLEDELLRVRGEPPG